MHAASRLLVPLLLISALLSARSASASDRLALLQARIELPAAPSTILSTDLDGDGRRDLVVVVAYTEWDALRVSDSLEMGEVEGAGPGAEGLVEVMTVIPALFDRRELLVFRGTGSGTYEPLGEPWPLETSVLSLEEGPPGVPVVALTDDGLSALRFEDGAFSLQPLLARRPVLAGTGTFVAELGMVRDLDGDGREDVLFPAFEAPAVYLSREGGLSPEPASLLTLAPPDPDAPPRVRHYPLPEARDADGDGLPELLLRHPEEGWEELAVLRNLGGGRFAPPVSPKLAEAGRKTQGEDQDEPNIETVYFGDLDGDGVAEMVSAEEPDEADGMRAEMKQAKRPPFVYRLYRTGEGFAPAAAPYRTFTALGYAFGGDEEVPLTSGFQDLDGDGRQDLVTLTLDFSIFQAVKILTVQRISIGIDFHIWCQGDGGDFQQVPDLDLSGKFTFNLNNLKLGRLSQFAGDFDGDGRADFVQMGRGRTVTIHRGQAGCRYPSRPDLTVELAEEPRDLGLVEVRDLDGDGLADLLVVQPQKVDEPGVTPPVRLDLYLSGGAP